LSKLYDEAKHVGLSEKFRDSPQSLMVDHRFLDLHWQFWGIDHFRTHAMEKLHV
jgi:hypothetical protein